MSRRKFFPAKYVKIFHFPGKYGIPNSGKIRGSAADQEDLL
jgi:hypothetical protein